MDMVLGKCNFPNSLLPYFKYYMLYVHVVGTHWNCLYEAIPMCTYRICFFQEMSFSPLAFFKKNSQPLSFIQRDGHVEMKNFSFSMSCRGRGIL